MNNTIGARKWLRATAAAVCAAAIFATVQAAPTWAADVTAPATIAASQTAAPEYIKSTNWDPTVKTQLNEFIATYGTSSPSYDPTNHAYAIFDFDNTTSILDMEEQLMIWQLDHLAFAIAPNQMSDVLKTGIPADKLNLTYGADDGSGKAVRISAAIADASQAYANLYNKGVVTTNGSELSAEVKNSADFKEFTSKMRWLYDAIGDTMDASVSYPWVTYWFTGMTQDQVYNLAMKCDRYYGDPQKGQTWTKGSYAGPKDLTSAAGPVSVSYKLGVTVTPEMKELYSALSQNGIDPWICSASPLDVIRAAVDYFKIPGVKGIVAMTNNKDAQGRYINSYDYAYHAQTQGAGKADTVDKVIRPLYNGRGPVFGAMDSQGDFNFATEYKDTKVVLVVNRTRTDDAALTAGIAAWQKEHHIGVKEAAKSGDTLYLLQGRNETKGSFWADDKTQQVGKKEAKGLSDKGQTAVDQLNQGKSVKQVLEDNTKLKDYKGYKNR